VAPNFDFAGCCNLHDQIYGRGGNADDRARADRNFSQCVTAANHPILARIYYLGVRVGGYALSADALALGIWPAITPRL
jgi:hypothetical protein